jgi:molecular chaperone Hsp33
MLRMLGSEEVHATLEQEGVLDINCEFCNKKYEFDRIDVEELFASEQPFKHSPTRH